jgi:hypothetical protein
VQEYLFLLPLVLLDSSCDSPCVSLNLLDSVTAQPPLWEAACLYGGVWDTPTTGLACSAVVVVCACVGVAFDFAWIAFIRVSTSVPKVTSLPPFVATLEEFILELALAKDGESVVTFHKGSDFIGGLWL